MFGKILIVDDNIDLLDSLKDILEANQYNVETASNGRKAIDICRKTKCDIIIMDIKLPDITGTEAVSKIFEINPDSEFIYITGNATLETAIEAIKQPNVVSYEIKPINIDRLLSTLKLIIDRKQSKHDISSTTKTLENILQATPFGIMIIGRDKIIRRANKTALEMLGLKSEEEITGKICHKTICPTEAGKCPICDLGLKLDKSERILLKRDGKEMPILKTVVPITINNEEVLLESFVDITFQKENETKLKESKEKFRLLFENSIFGIGIMEIIYDENGKPIDLLHLEANPATEIQANYKLDKIIGEKGSEIATKDELESLLDIFNRVVKTGKSETHEIYIKAYDRTLEIGAYHVSKNIIAVNFIDISNRVKTLNELKAGEAKFKAIFNEPPILEGILKPNGITMQINRAALSFIDRKESEVTNVPFWETPWWTHSKEEQNKLKLAIERTARGETVNYETTHVNHKGELRFIDFSLTPITDETGLVKYLVPVGHDITEIKKATEALRDSETKFRALAENAQDTIMRFDHEHRHLYVNPVVEKQTGIPSKDFIGKTHSEMGFPEDLVKLWGNAIDKVFQTGETNRIEFKLPTGIWIDWLLVPELTDNGIVKAVVASARDITDRMEYEQSLDEQKSEISEIQEATFNMLEDLQEAKEETDKYAKNLEEKSSELTKLIRRIESLVESMVEGVIMIDENGEIVIINPQARKMLSLESKALVTSHEICKTIGMMDFYDEKQECFANLSQFDQIPKSFRFKVDKKIIHIEMNIIKSKLDIPIGVGIVLRDITKEAEVDRLKDEFISTLSHELRTPLNSIIGYTDLVLRDKNLELPEKRQRNLEGILSNADNLLSLINNVLDLARAEAGGMQVNPSKINIGTLIDECIISCHGLVGHKNIDIQKYIAPHMPHYFTDEMKLKRIIINLLSNAIKFTDEGKIDINIQLSKENNGFVDISISDTGIGIPEDRKEIIFDQFRQVDSSSTRKYSGTGLGLAIVKKYVELLGGSVSLTSKVDFGTTFIVELPINYQSENSISEEMTI